MSESVVEGLKCIAAELQRIWRRTVSGDAVWRYSHSRRDPLPLEKVRGRVFVTGEALEEWARRQLRPARERTS